MHEFGICANRNELCALGPEVRMPACQVGKFGGSNEREISRIEEKDRPFAILPQVIEVYLLKTACFRVEGLDLEIGCLLAYP